MTPNEEQRPSLATGAPEQLTDDDHADYTLQAARSARSFFQGQQAARRILADVDPIRLFRRFAEDLISSAIPEQWEWRAAQFDAVRPKGDEWLAPGAAELDQAAADDAYRCRLHAARLRSMEHGTDVIDEIAEMSARSVGKNDQGAAE